jgi:glycine reductase
LGIPAALITAIPPIALTVGANRVVKGVAIPHPVGKPDEEGNVEFALRKSLFNLALKALCTEIDDQTVFKLEK